MLLQPGKNARGGGTVGTAGGDSVPNVTVEGTLKTSVSVVDHGYCSKVKNL